MSLYPLFPVSNAWSADSESVKMTILLTDSGDELKRLLMWSTVCIIASFSATKLEQKTPHGLKSSVFVPLGW